MTIRINNINGFNREVKAFGQDLMPEAHLKLQKRIAADLLRRIIFRTPVDTGRARGNWQVRKGGSSEKTISNLDTAGGATFSVGISAIRAINQPYGVITIFNNVNYINILEGGGSQQAPQGMVTLSVIEVESQF